MTKNDKGNKKQEVDINKPQYLIGVAVKEIGCTAQTLKNYEAQGLLKSKVGRDSYRRRRYSWSQINDLKAIWQARNFG